MGYLGRKPPSVGKERQILPAPEQNQPNSFFLATHWKSISDMHYILFIVILCNYA